MPKCKVCGKQFHACGSCGLIHSWEYEYCSESHWQESTAYMNMLSSIEYLKETLNENRAFEVAKAKQFTFQQ